MLNLKNILQEMVSRQDVLGIYKKLYPQMSLPFEQEDAIKHFNKLIEAYAKAIGAGERGMLRHMIDSPDLHNLFLFLQEEIGHEYGSSTIKLTRGLSVSKHNEEFKDWKRGQTVILEAHANDLLGFTDDEGISAAFAKCGDGLPQGMSREDAEYGDGYQDTDATSDWPSMIGFVFEATIPINNIYFAPRLLESEFFKELFEVASEAGKGYTSAYELKSESEFIVGAPIQAKIVDGYVYCDDPNWSEWEDVDHPYKVRQQYDKENWSNEY